MNKGQLRAHFLALLNRSDCTDTLADTFIFNVGHGQDRLSGLELQDEVHLSLALTQGLTSAEDIVSRFARVVEDDVVLWFSRDNQIVFEDGVTAADLTEVILTF